MIQLQDLIDKSHVNPIQSKQHITRINRKDWDIKQMAINSTKFDKNKQSKSKTPLQQRPLNEIV